MISFKRNRNSPVPSLIIFFAAYLCWSAWQLFVAPKIAFWDGFIWLNVVIQGVVWICPALLVFFAKRDGWLEFPGRMFCTSFPSIPFLGMLCGTVCFLYTVRIFSGLQNTYVLWDWNFLLFALSAGVIEELFFRGFLFNRMGNALGVLPGAMINGLLFALYHFPGVICSDFSGFFSLRLLMLFAVGVLFCLAFARWKNLWLTILVHSIWNLISYLWALAG